MDVAQERFNVDRTLAHELTHALQACYEQAGGCVGSLKNEIEARYCAGECSYFQTCLLGAVGSSCFKGQYCSNPDEIKKHMAELRTWFKEMQKGDNPRGFCKFK